jgi:hypothetical protein
MVAMDMLAVIARGSHLAVGAGASSPAVAAEASHPAVAVWFALGAAALAAVVVAMAWSVHARQIRLAELLVRRQFLVIADTGGAGRALDEGGRGILGGGGTEELEGAARNRPGSPEAIEGPDNLVSGQQARYRVRTSGPQQVVSWAVGGGSVSQSPDPAHPDELLLIADQPGQLTITARVREGLTERRESKSVTAVPDVTTSTPPFTLRLFLNGWGLVVVAVLIVGFAGALDALGNFTSSDFIALVVPLAALLGVIAVARGATDTGSHPGHAGHSCHSCHGKGPGQV